MASYKLFLITFCEVLLLNTISCKLFECIEYSTNPYASTCTINTVDCIEPNEFEYNNPYGGSHHVQTLKFVNSHISYIPHGIFTRLPQLTTIDLSESHLLEVHLYDFLHGTNLNELLLAYNSLVELKDSSFYGIENVAIIDLSHNQIAVIGSQTFKNLSKITKIDLSNNKLKVVGIFSNLLYLRSLDLSENIIVRVYGGYDSLNLTELNLASNKIDEISDIEFEDIKFIKHLNLDFNRLNRAILVDLTGYWDDSMDGSWEGVDFDQARDAVNIEHISLVANNLTAVHINKYCQILRLDHNKLVNENLRIDRGRNLRELSIVNNSLSSLDFIKHMENLESLDVSFNPLGSIGPAAESQISNDTFSNLTKLTVLSLESANLQQIDFQLFATLHNLKTLDISYNNLSTINFHTLSFLDNLQELYINGNNLKQLAIEDFDYLFPNLNVIDISDNMWLCSDLMEILKKLQRLKISIYTDEDRMVRNDRNIRGLRCFDHDDDGTVNTSQNEPHVIHKTHVTPHNVAYVVAELNETKMALQKLKLEDEQVKMELHEILSMLENATSWLNAQPKSCELDEYVKSINDQIGNLTRAYNDAINTFNLKLSTAMATRPIDLNGNDDVFSRMTADTISRDLKFIKILLGLLLAVSTVFVTMKCYRVLTRGRPNPRRHRYNTMATVINENNV